MVLTCKSVVDYLSISAHHCWNCLIIYGCQLTSMIFPWISLAVYALLSFINLAWKSCFSPSVQTQLMSFIPIVQSVSHRQWSKSHQSLSIIVNHCKSLSIIVIHCKSLSIIVNHCLSLSIIVNHCESLSIIVYHFQSLQIILNHCQSLSILVNHFHPLSSRSWVRGVSAGGRRNLAVNPRFRINLQAPTDCDERRVPLIVSLTQKNRRLMRNATGIVRRGGKKR